VTLWRRGRAHVSFHSYNGAAGAKRIMAALAAIGPC
jgi:hypothetical protein